MDRFVSLIMHFHSHFHRVILDSLTIQREKTRNDERRNETELQRLCVRFLRDDFLLLGCIALERERGHLRMSSFVINR